MSLRITSFNNRLKSMACRSLSGPLGRHRWPGNQLPPSGFLMAAPSVTKAWLKHV